MKAFQSTQRAAILIFLADLWFVIIFVYASPQPTQNVSYNPCPVEQTSENV